MEALEIRSAAQYIVVGGVTLFELFVVSVYARTRASSLEEEDVCDVYESSSAPEKFPSFRSQDVLSLIQIASQATSIRLN